MRSTYIYLYENENMDNIKSHIFRCFFNDNYSNKSELTLENFDNIQNRKSVKNIENNEYVLQVLNSKRNFNCFEFQIKVEQIFISNNQFQETNLITQEWSENEDNLIVNKGKIKKLENDNAKNINPKSIIIDFSINKALNNVVLFMNIYGTIEDMNKHKSHKFFYFTNSNSPELNTNILFDLKEFRIYLENLIESIKIYKKRQINKLVERNSIIIDFPIKLISSKISDINFLTEIKNDEGGCITDIENNNVKTKPYSIEKIKESEYSLTDYNTNLTFKLILLCNEEYTDGFRISYKLEVQDSVHLYQLELTKIEINKTLLKITFGLEGGITDDSKSFKEIESLNFLKFFKRYFTNDLNHH